MADTIAAISTGNVVSAIGIVRISGEDTINVLEKVFEPDFNISLHNFEDRKLYLGKVVDAAGEELDHCLCTVSRAPHSYTGENTAELHCHGSPTILAKTLEALFQAGARQAKAGEFTKRAFLNGQMDLTQAEAVIDLIEAESAEVAKNAAGQLGRSISRKTNTVYAELIDIMSHFHAVIDYPDDEIEDFQLRNYLEVLNRSETVLQNLMDSFARGQLMKDGVKCAIIGRPNVGKSSLLNALVGYDRAIVTDIEGTTRDVIEEKIRLDDIVVRLADTAGLRDTEDKVERIGVERTEEEAKNADLVLAVFDGNRELSEEDLAVLQAASKAEKVVAVINKSDLPQKLRIGDIESRLGKSCIISVETGDGVRELCDRICELFGGVKKISAGEILTNSRQAECISRAITAINDAKNALNEGVTPDAVLTCVEDAIASLGELTGRSIREDVVHRIFERFCIGK